MRKWYFIWCLCSINAFSQNNVKAHSVSFTLQPIALLSLSSSSSLNVNLNFQAPTDAGVSLITPSSSTTTWLNFTSAVPGGSRVISVHSSAVIPSNIKLTLEVSGPVGSGGGNRGGSVGSVEISNVQQNIITGIGGAYTGVGAGNGYQLKYTATILQYEGLKAQSLPLLILYTLSDF